MSRKDIQSRADVHFLVTKFYEKLRSDDNIGYFFNETISDWDAHLELLTTFWESSLFITRKLEHKYSGDPLKVHVEVDAKFDHAIKDVHFGIWLNHWYQTIDAYFEGEVADNAKRRARKMGTFLYMKIFEARQN